MPSKTLFRLSAGTLLISSLLLILVSIVSIFLNATDPKTVTSSFSSLLFDIGLGFLYLIVLPYLAETAPKSLSSGGPPTLFVFYILAGTMFSLGGILFGLAIIRAALLPRSTGLLLVLSGVIGFINSIPLP